MSCHRTVLSILCIVGLVAAGAFSSDDSSLQASPPFAEKSSSPQPPRRAVEPKANELPGETATDEERPTRIYERTLTRIDATQPLLADHPEFIEPITGTQRFCAPRLVDDEKADLSVRAWHYSYNARGIIEVPNRLRSDLTAVIVVHPWAIDDGQGWVTPEPAGIAFFGTRQKNRLAARHTREVVDPFLKRMRNIVPLIMYSLPGDEDPIRKNLYRSISHRPTSAQRHQTRQALHKKLTDFSYLGEPVPSRLTLSTHQPISDYFRQFPGSVADDKYNHAGFWKLPIPVTRDINVHPDDVVIYDAQGYEALKSFLVDHRIRHVLLTGYATDMCFCATTAGYKNLSRDFNVFLVGDATLATFPANATPRYATNTHIALASIKHLVTQISWITPLVRDR